MPPYLGLGKTTYDYRLKQNSKKKIKFSDWYGINHLDKGNNVSHIFTDSPTLTERQHAAAVMSDAAYSLPNYDNSNILSQERFLNKMRESTVHKDLVSNLKPLYSSQDDIYLQDNRLVSYKGEEGHICYFVARGSAFDNSKTMWRDGANDLAIATGSPTHSSFMVGQRLTKLINENPQCIYTVATGHSKSAHDLARVGWRVKDGEVILFEQGQTLSDIKNFTNLFRDGSNITDHRAVCDNISKGNGSPNSTVIHFDTGDQGWRDCHGLENWKKLPIRQDTTGPKLISIPNNKGPSDINQCSLNFDNSMNANFSIQNNNNNGPELSSLKDKFDFNDKDFFNQSSPDLDDSINKNVIQNINNEFNNNSPELQKLMDKFSEDFFTMQQEDGQAIILNKIDVNEILRNTPDPGKKLESFDKFVSGFTDKIHEVKSNLEKEFSDVASANNTVALLDSYLLDFERVYSLKGMKKSHKAKFLGSMVLKKISQSNEFLKHCGKNLSFGTKILADFIENKKIKLQNVVETVLQHKFGIPIRELSNTIKHLIKGKSIRKDLKNLIKEYARFLIPQVGAVMGILELGKHLKGIVRNLTEKTYHKEIGGFDVGVKEKLSFRGLKKPHKKVELYCDILGILISRTSKSYAQSFEDASSEFNRQAFYKAYEVFGIPYEFFDPEREKPETRLDMLRDSRYLRNCETFWMDVNNLNEDERKLIDHVRHETSEQKRIRLECLVTGRKNSLWNEHSHKNVFEYLKIIANELSGCRSTTDIIKKLYSIGWITGHNGEKFEFSGLGKCFIKYIFWANPDKIADHMNYQTSDLTDKQIDEKVKSAETKEQSSVMDLIKKLKQIRLRTPGLKNGTYENKGFELGHLVGKDDQGREMFIVTKDGHRYKASIVSKPNNHHRHRHLRRHRHRNHQRDIIIIHEEVDSQNVTLDRYIDDENSNFKNKTGDYSEDELIGFAHKELLKEEMSARFVFGVLSQVSFGVFVSSVIYMDYEVAMMKQGLGKYTMFKGLQLGGAFAQGYCTNVLTGHIMTQVANKCLSYSEEFIRDVISVNVGILTATGVTAGFCLMSGQFSGKSGSDQIKALTRNLLQVNIVPISKYLLDWYSPGASKAVAAKCMSFLPAFLKVTTVTAGVASTTLNAFMLPFVIQGLYRLLEEIQNDNVLPDNKEEIALFKKENLRREIEKIIKMYESMKNDFYKRVIYRKMRSRRIVKFNGNVTVVKSSSFIRRTSESIGCDI